MNTGPGDPLHHPEDHILHHPEVASGRKNNRIAF